jgi:hypothetical protein
MIEYMKSNHDNKLQRKPNTDNKGNLFVTVFAICSLHSKLDNHRVINPDRSVALNKICTSG